MPRSHAFPTVEAAAADKIVAVALGLCPVRKAGKLRTVRRYVGLQAVPGAADPFDRVVGICAFPGCAARGGHRLDFETQMEARVHCSKCGTSLAAAAKLKVGTLPVCETQLDRAGNVVGWQCAGKKDCAARAVAPGLVTRPVAAAHPDAPVTRGTTATWQARPAERAAAPPPPPQRGFKRLHYPATPPPGLAAVLPGVAALERYADFVEEDEGALCPFAARLGCGPPVDAPPEEWFLPPPQ